MAAPAGPPLNLDRPDFGAAQMPELHRLTRSSCSSQREPGCSEVPKFTEHSFYECSAWRHKGSSRRLGNPNPERCNSPLEVAEDVSRCHQSSWGRRYWEHLAPNVDREALGSLPICPAARHGYQLFRQQALAEGIARSGKYDLVVSAVAMDERNGELEAGLRRSGIDGFEQWGRIFRGSARFAVFTHQEWVDWVRDNGDSRWGDWLSYVTERYDLRA